MNKLFFFKEERGGTYFSTLEYAFSHMMLSPMEH